MTPPTIAKDTKLMGMPLTIIISSVATIAIVSMSADLNSIIIRGSRMQKRPQIYSSN